MTLVVRSFRQKGRGRAKKGQQLRQVPQQTRDQFRIDGLPLPLDLARFGCRGLPTVGLIDAPERISDDRLIGAAGRARADRAACGPQQR